MSGPRNTEPQANYELARALRRRNPDWTDRTVHAERTNVIQQSVSGSGAAKRPDILIAAPRRQPVILETEFDPAHTVDLDATARLGKSLHETGEDIEGVLSVVLPKNLKTADLETIDGATFRYATHYLDSQGESVRWPAGKEWLKGGVDDLADAVEYLSLSERQLARGTAVLEQVVRNAARLLGQHAGEDALGKIASDLHQEAGEQTERMAAAIFVSAFAFHVAIEEQENIPPVALAGSIDKGRLLATWNAILEVNYWPIFSVARDLLMELPVKAVPPVMNRIAESISDLAQLGATTYHDLTGRMFQTLITDRKFLATFYTLPESACLLAELAVERLDVDWSDKDAIEGLRIADFACGTGALLSAAQRAVYRRYRRAGGNDKDLHQALMERVLTGLDIMPAATHLTCSMLSSAHPSLGYGKSRIHTMPYGIDGGRTHIGALDLLDSEHSYSLFAAGESMGGTESDSRREHSVTIEDRSCDLVIMNPPFTRPTNHEGSHAEIPIPSFAGFNTPDSEQKVMSRMLRKCKSEFGHGNAGLASNFMDLGHRKLKDGGVLAFVLPFSLTQGHGWNKARKALAKNYSDIHILSIAATGMTDRAFSADTDMAECLVVASKRSGGEARFTNLSYRPSALLESALTAKEAGRGSPNASAIHRTFGGTLLDPRGEGVLSESVGNVARALCRGELALPLSLAKTNIPVTKLGEIATRGLVDRDINGKPPKSGAPPRGAFEIRPIHKDEIPTYPALWNHDAERERQLVVLPDKCGDVRPEMESHAVETWSQTASRLHSNRDFRLNSQSLAMCLTPEKCLGGTAWPNVIPQESRYETPLLLWCNSTLGLILFWWYGTRQQAGRPRLTISKLPALPVLDPRALTDTQIDHCNAIFDDLKGCVFLPANEAYCDETRKTLDRDLLFGVTSVLQLDPSLEEGLDLLRRQWCAEPSVHGGKGTRIHG
ncbi:MAG: hypothetical protein F4X12_04675 [Acidobacteriia bacterium]|nr:hypothetical protein [Terriglobia bacterium]